MRAGRIILIAVPVVLALAVAGAKLQGTIRFGGSAVSQIRQRADIFLQGVERGLALTQNLVFPGKQLAAEILFLPRIHKVLVLAGTIPLRQLDLGFKCAHTTASMTLTPLPMSAAENIGATHQVNDA